ncbi:hypothetical protein QC761_511875 [Podospora bellae-mahoneyi]|uniref:Uncharacterized protein n=1 Tax=Podospora bellae-mahoneyi TaxID=2093777 RepID=A0ABR0FGG3_9PEZI|nr:hypothetical protein QC761_511875 [Podospora bellae-mahoneyi]
MPLSKTIPLDEYLEAHKENLNRESEPRPIAQPTGSYAMPLRPLFDMDEEMTEEEARFFNRRYQTFVDNANTFIANQCQTPEEAIQFLVRRVARQDAAVDRLERKFTKSVAAAVEQEIDIFFGNKPTLERIRGINRRLNQMQLELKTFKDEVKAHPEFSGSPEDVKARKAAMAVAAGVANQSKKRKKVAGTAVPVGNGAGQGPDGLDMIYESLNNIVSHMRDLRSNSSLVTASDEEQCLPQLGQLQLTTPTKAEHIMKEDDAHAKLDGAGDDAEMADDEASQMTATLPLAVPASAANTPTRRLGSEITYCLPVRTVE